MWILSNGLMLSFFPFREFINSLRLHRSFYGGLADQLCIAELAAAEGRPCWNGEDIVKRWVLGRIPFLPWFLLLEPNRRITVGTLPRRLEVNPFCVSDYSDFSYHFTLNTLCVDLKLSSCPPVSNLYTTQPQNCYLLSSCFY